MKQNRAKLKGITHKARTVSPKLTVDVVKAIQSIPNYGLPDCACLHCRANRKTGNKFILNHGPRKVAAELGTNEINRVSLPGDADYAGVITQSMMKASPTSNR